MALYDERLVSPVSGVPPPCSRLPPDGHEFPPSYTDGIPDNNKAMSSSSSTRSYNRYSHMAIDMDTSAIVPIQHSRSAPGTPVGHPPSIPRCSPQSSSAKTYAIDKKSDLSVSKWSLDEGSNNREAGNGRSNSRWRRQDEKSERSVRDKIAMFSSEKSEQPHSKTRKLDKHEIQEGYIKRSLTEDNVCTETSSSMSSDIIRDSSRSLSKAAGFSSMINVSTSETKENIKPITATYSELDIRKDSSPTIVKETQKIQKPKDDSDKNGLNERSQSLSDIGRPTLIKRHSMGAYDSTIFKYGGQKQDEKERRTSLTNLIEQRRKSMSKLRGLVIPESQMNSSSNKKSSLDLPRISSVSPTTPHKTSSLPREGHRQRISKAESFSSFDSTDSSSKVRQSANSSFQKRSPSPVVKKKSINSLKKNDSLPPAGRHYNNQDSTPITDQLLQSPNSAFHSSNSSFRDLDTSSESDYPSSVHSFTKHIISQKNSLESKYSLDDDSDNDSALSSTQSSLSQLSTPSSPVPGHYQDDRHQKYRSQSSYDEHDPRRFLKRGSIEAENRRNILNSARCSSGRGSDNDNPEEMNKFDCDTESLTQFLQADREKNRTRNYRNRHSTSSTSSAASSRRSSHDSHDSSRRNSRESVIHVIKKDETKVSAEPVYFDQEGDMYKESQLKVAYLNEVEDNFEQTNEIPANKVIAEVPVASSTLHNTESAKKERPFSLRKSSPVSELNTKYNINNDSKIVESKRSITETKSYTNDRKVNSFQALAEKWQNRDENASNTDTIRRKSSSKISPLSPTSPTPKVLSVQYPRTPNKPIQRDNIPDRKLSMPEYSSKGVILRDRQEGAGGGVPSRPTSLIEGGDALDNHNHYLNASTLSPSASMNSHDELCSPDNLSRTGSKEVLDAFSKPRTGFTFTSNRNGASNIPKMSDIMRAFERHDLKRFSFHGSHPRMSSLDSNTSEDGSIGAHYGSITSLASGQRDQYGSITSLASSTSLISPQELASLIEEANQSLEESGTPSHEIMVVVLHREVVAHGSIGITLHGGADYEAKEITIHKVIPGGLADRDGRLQRGDRVLSINGKNLRGVTHREALNILKSPRPEVVLVLSRSRSVTPQETMGMDNDYGYIHRTPLINHTTSTRPPKILESPMDSKSLVSDAEAMLTPRGAPITTTLLKDGAGLGFSLEGGKDSPLGDRPLTIKKIFSGGAADKSGFLKVGDEIVSINSVDVTKMARIEAWNYLKKLPDGTVTLNIRQKLETSSKSEE